MSTLSRRSIVTGAAALPALAVPALALPAADPSPAKTATADSDARIEQLWIERTALFAERRADDENEMWDEARAEAISQRLDAIEDAIEAAPASPTKAAVMFIMGLTRCDLGTLDNVSTIADGLLPLMRQRQACGLAAYPVIRRRALSATASAICVYQPLQQK
jgi:hypothetical protein